MSGVSRFSFYKSPHNNHQGAINYYSNSIILKNIKNDNYQTPYSFSEDIPKSDPVPNQSFKVNNNIVDREFIYTKKAFQGVLSSGLLSANKEKESIKIFHKISRPRKLKLNKSLKNNISVNMHNEVHLNKTKICFPELINSTKFKNPDEKPSYAISDNILNKISPGANKSLIINYDPLKNATRKIKTIEKILDIKDNSLPIISHNPYFSNKSVGVNELDFNVKNKLFIDKPKKASYNNLFYSSNILKSDFKKNFQNINSAICENQNCLLSTTNLLIIKEDRIESKDDDILSDSYLAQNNIFSSLNIKINKTDNSEILKDIKRVKSLIIDFLDANIDNLISNSYIDDRFKAFDFKIKSKYAYRISKEFIFFYYLNTKANQNVKIKKFNRNQNSGNLSKSNENLNKKNWAFEFFMSNSKNFIKEISEFNSYIKLILPKVTKNINSLLAFFNSITHTHLPRLILDNFFVYFYIIRNEDTLIDNKLIAILIDFISKSDEKKFYFENFLKMKMIPNEEIKDFTQEIFLHHFYFLKKYFKEIFEISDDLIQEVKLSLHITDNELSKIFINDENKIELMGKNLDFRIRISSIYLTLLKALI